MTYEGTSEGDNRWWGTGHPLILGVGGLHFWVGVVLLECDSHRVPPRLARIDSMDDTGKKGGGVHNSRSAFRSLMDVSVTARRGEHNGMTYIIQIKEAVLIDEGLSAFDNGLVRIPRSGQYEVVGDELVDYVAEL